MMPRAESVQDARRLAALLWHFPEQSEPDEWVEKRDQPEVSPPCEKVNEPLAHRLRILHGQHPNIWDMQVVGSESRSGTCS